jgi:cyclopropane fatty-acyl-phospholipid synthase-like methyltransferase
MSRMRSLLAACGLVLAANSVSAQSPQDHPHTFRDAGRWAQVFDDPERDAWQKPREVIQALALEPGAHVADLGAGTGYFTVRLANVLPEGRVYAVDIETDMVRYLESRAQREGLRNVTALKGQPDDPRLPGPVDLVLLVDVYHHIGDRTRYFRNLSRSLRPGGRVAIVDFRPDSPAGPPRAARIAPETVKAEMKAAGYAVTAEHRFLPYQYFVVFRPAS